MSKPTILVTGANGLIGSKFVSDFSDQYQFVNLDINDPENPVDITNVAQVQRAVLAHPNSFLVHFAAYTNVTGAWEQNGDKSGLAYRVNVEGTSNIVKACNEANTHLIHISTAYVFDGENSDLYSEDDKPNPIEWYGQTKFEAEQVVQNDAKNWTILRIDQPFRSDKFERPDTVRRIISGLKENSLYPQFTNHFFGPTYIDDFSQVLDWVARTKTTGLFHASSGESWSDHEFAKLIQSAHGLGGEIKEGNLEDYLAKLDRPYQKNTAMSNQKLVDAIDFELLSVADAVAAVEL